MHLIAKTVQILANVTVVCLIWTSDLLVIIVAHIIISPMLKDPVKFVTVLVYIVLMKPNILVPDVTLNYISPMVLDQVNVSHYKLKIMVIQTSNKFTAPSDIL